MFRRLVSRAGSGAQLELLMNPFSCFNLIIIAVAVAFVVVVDDDESSVEEL